MKEPPSCKVQVLGPVELHAPGAAGPTRMGSKSQAMLAWLAARGHAGGPRHVLVDLLWADSAQADARNALRQCLFQMRRAMAPASLLRAGRESLQLDAPLVSVDLWRFQAQACSERAEDRLAACTAYTGDFAQDLQVTPAFDDWAAAERERLRRAAALLVSRLCEDALDAAGLVSVTALARRILAADPLQEGCWRALMTLHARQGLRATVETDWHECRLALRLHAGTEPSLATREVHECIARQEPRSTVHLSLARHRPPPPHPDDACAAAHDHYLRGMSHFFNGTRGDNALARAAWESAAALVPGRSDYGMLAAWTHFSDWNLGFTHAAPVSLRLAASRSRALLGRFPQDPWPRLLEGKLRLWRGQYQDALTLFGEALAMRPDTPPMWSNMADALLRAGKPRDALDHIRVAMDLQPDDRGYLPYVAASAHFALRQLDEAKEAFGSSVRRNGAFCPAYGGLAAVHGELGERDAAAQAIRHARFTRGLPFALHVLGPHADKRFSARWTRGLVLAGLKPP